MGGDCQAFLDQLADLRFGAGGADVPPAAVGPLPAHGHAHRLLRYVWGEKRRENLLTFSQLARRFEGPGTRASLGSSSI